MTKTTRIAHSLFALACISAAAAGCTANANPSDPSMGSGGAMGLDPTGNWSLTYSFAPGCGQAASQAASTFTVTLGQQGYDVEIAGTQTAGTLTCTATACKLSAVFVWMDSTGTSFQQSANINLDMQDNITGSGTESVMSTAMNCNIAFTVAGTRQ